MGVVKINNWTYSFCTAFIDLRLSNTSVGFIIDKDLSFEAHWDIYVRNCQNDLDFWGILVLISISPVYYNKNFFNQVIRFVWQKQRVFTIKSSKSIFDLYAVWRKRKVFTKCDRGVKHAWNVLQVTCTCLVVTDLVSNHCYNYRYYLLTGMVVIIGASRRPVLIELLLALEQLFAVLATYNIYQTRRSQWFHRKLQFMRIFLNVYRPFE